MGGVISKDLCLINHTEEIPNFVDFSKIIFVQMKWKLRDK